MSSVPPPDQGPQTPKEIAPVDPTHPATSGPGKRGGKAVAGTNMFAVMFPQASAKELARMMGGLLQSVMFSMKQDAKRQKQAAEQLKKTIEDSN